MDVFLGIENLPGNYENAVICLGNFDGIHFGHQQIINSCITEAKSQNVKSLLVTFEIHPRIIFAEKSNREVTPLLNTNEEKNAILEKTGIDGVLYLKTSDELLGLGADEFVRSIIIKKIKVSKVIFGYDFHFGKDRKGNVDLMLKCGEKYNFEVIQVDAVQMGEEIVKSSLIRKHLIDGELEKSENLLGYPYHFAGEIVHGSGRGTALGFPTANVDVSNKYKLIPAYGVYFTKLKINKEIKYGLCNIGVRPTFDEHDLVIEIFIYDLDETDIYDRHVEVTMLQRLRDEIRYETVDELVDQMNIDKTMGQNLIKLYN